MPRVSSVAHRGNLQASRPSQKRLSSSARSALFTFTDSPKVAADQVAAAASAKNDLDEVPDSQPPASQSMHIASVIKYI